MNEKKHTEVWKEDLETAKFLKLKLKLKTLPDVWKKAIQTLEGVEK
jgi:hypothetical protein